MASLCLAALVILFELDKRRPWLKRTAAMVGAAAVAVVFVGNVAVDSPPDTRFPGPYEFGSDSLSVTPETLSFAHWVQAHLGSGAHVVTDRFTAEALTTHADAVTPLQGPGLPISNIWYGRLPPSPALMSNMEYLGDDYLAIDARDARYIDDGAPLFFLGEPDRVPQRNFNRLARWPWSRSLYSSETLSPVRIDFHSYFRWDPSYVNHQ